MLIKSVLRDWLSVSYGMISILVIGSLRSPPYPAAPDFLHGKACHTILRSLCSLTARLSPTHNILRVTAFLQNMFAGVTRVPLPPLCRGQNKTPRSLASSAQRIAKNKVPPPGGRWWRQPPKGGHCLNPGHKSGPIAIPPPSAPQALSPPERSEPQPFYATCGGAAPLF